ncbi:oligosaccharide flippase family protein [Litoreibacter arenae]|uniref:Polysaccharide biosynthesis protein n=1 Tax=Litoreibacter arenae DSM 19593 TaxID=1123360 RepID=S9QC46_9RHOB|nr:oligosaccharide flippase family protein [Litoreibacter arenae]EPX77517.1 hypothetical protein thalar_03241 [Litoreibacter arenae DSM 19593]
MTRIATLLSGHGLAALAGLARNLLIARLLGPEGYGLAAALIILTAAAEMATTLGLPQLIVSRPNGASAKTQAALHAVQVTRGVVGAALVLLCAGPLATALDAPDAAPILRSAAIVPFILGFTHLDAFRAQRQGRHLPQTLVLAVPAIVSVAVFWPFAAWLTGPQIMLFLLLVQACATVATSHLVARRRYRLRIDAGLIAVALRYGLPLTANGVLMFAVLHAEKLIAGASLGLAQMGVLAMGLTLTMTPALILARSFQAYHLPRMRTCSIPVMGLGFLLGASLAATLAALVPLGLPVLGARFSGLAELVPMLSCIAAMRLPKSSLAVTALSQGRTHLPALANLPRVLALPVIWFALAQGGGVETLLALALGAEVAGLLLGGALARTGAFPTRDIALSGLAFGTVLSGQPGLGVIVCLIAWAAYGMALFPQSAGRIA